MRDEAVGLLLLATARCLLGCFEGVDLDVFGFDLDLDMGGKVAETTHPLHFGSGVGAADTADGAVDNPIAAFTVFDDGLAGAVHKDATLFSPKRTLFAGEYSLTLHDDSS
jgi:hypothetical protein